MDIVITSGSPVELNDGLRAGFLLSGATKSYVAFEVPNEDQPVVLKRDCTGEERKALAKIVYHARSVRSYRRTTTAGEPCLLFVGK